MRGKRSYLKNASRAANLLPLQWKDVPENYERTYDKNTELNLAQPFTKKGDLKQRLGQLVYVQSLANLLGTQPIIVLGSKQRPTQKNPKSDEGDQRIVDQRILDYDNSYWSCSFCFNSVKTKYDTSAIKVKLNHLHSPKCK